VPKREWDTLLGIRRDVDLTERWWHRLFKVVYLSLLTLVVAFMGFFLWSGLDDLPARTNQIEVIASLADVLREADESVDNVVPIFMKKEGATGYYEPGSRKIERVWDTDLEDSFCSPAAIRHVGSLSRFLNRRQFSTAYSPEVMTQTIMKDRKPGDSLRLCWMDSSLQDKDLNNLIKYEFTALGYFGAAVNYLAPYVVWTLVVHAVILNFYYRGLVYIIVGKRKKPHPKPREDENDDDDDDELSP
jgi:hypothetical protein